MAEFKNIIEIEVVLSINNLEDRILFPPFSYTTLVPNPRQHPHHPHHPDPQHQSFTTPFHSSGECKTIKGISLSPGIQTRLDTICQCTSMQLKNLIFAQLRLDQKAKLQHSPTGTPHPP